MTTTTERVIKERIDARRSYYGLMTVNTFGKTPEEQYELDAAVMAATIRLNKAEAAYDRLIEEKPE
jgi:hypothetical protein